MPAERQQAIRELVAQWMHSAARYPGEEEPVTRQEAREAAELATRVLVWVETQLEKEQ
jgi:HEPN domain-containing protein